MDTKSKLERARHYNFMLMGKLLSNEVHERQEDCESIQELANKLRDWLPADKIEELPTFDAVNALILADGFAWEPLAPTHGHLLEYLTSLNIDVRASTLGANGKTKEMVSRTLPWLLSRFREIVNYLGKFEEFSLLHHFLINVATSVHSTGLGRPCLFLIAANLAHRSREMASGKFLKCLLDNVMVHKKFGLAYEDWDLLDRICFGWLLSRTSTTVSLAGICDDAAICALSYSGTA